MRTSIRLTLLALTSLVALAFANGAWAAYEPRLLVATERVGLSAPTPVVIGVAQSRDDDPTAKIDITVPEGFQESLTASPGTVIGEVNGTVILRGAGNAEVAVSGQVKADNPATYASNQCAPGVHNAVWVLSVTLAGTPVNVPIYVDDVQTVPGVSARIQLCLAGPIGTPSGSQLLSAVFEIRDVFTNPSTRAVYTWSALFTPYVLGTPQPNPGGTVESRAAQPIPVSVVINAKRKGTRVTITGKVNIPGNAVPARIQLWQGPSARRLRRVIASVRVKANGTFTVVRKVSKRTRIQAFQARLDTLFGDAAPFGYCQTPPPRAPRGCVSATFAALYVRSNVKTVRFPRR